MSFYLDGYSGLALSLCPAMPPRLFPLDLHEGGVAVALVVYLSQTLSTVIQPGSWFVTFLPSVASWSYLPGVQSHVCSLRPSSTTQDQRQAFCGPQKGVHLL